QASPPVGKRRARRVWHDDDRLQRRRAHPVDLSVIVITRNEEANIAECLASVGFAGEIVVVDSASTDSTAHIAQQAGAKVVSTADWPGFGAQKNRALDLATKTWVLSIDADERVTPQLQ